MIADELINHTLPTLKPEDSAAQALDWMQEFRVGQLALVADDDFKGLIDEAVLLDVADDNIQLAHVQPQHTDAFIYNSQHLLEALQLAQSQQLDVVPVLDEDRQFAGTIPTSDLLRKFSQLIGLQELGALLVLNVEARDYSLSEISRLVESNDVKIVSSYFTSGSVEQDIPSTLTLKLNRREITAVVATLERYGYDVDATYANDRLLSPDQERLGMLFKYLDI
jgi:signal-transduction protein with cAMP-binding, CBS, and nucleotidyltransferase domain